MSDPYSLIVGDLKPDMEIDLSNQLSLLTGALSVDLEWTKPDGTVSLVPLVVVDAPTGVLKRVWSSGDTAQAGIHKGRVRITTSAALPAHWPDDGTWIEWVIWP